MNLQRLHSVNNEKIAAVAEPLKVITRQNSVFASASARNLHCLHVCTLFQSSRKVDLFPRQHFSPDALNDYKRDVSSAGR
jgi:hypothetical protein